MDALIDARIFGRFPGGEEGAQGARRRVDRDDSDDFAQLGACVPWIRTFAVGAPEHLARPVEAGNTEHTADKFSGALSASAADAGHGRWRRFFVTSMDCTKTAANARTAIVLRFPVGGTVVRLDRGSEVGTVKNGQTVDFPVLDSGDAG